MATTKKCDLNPQCIQGGRAANCRSCAERIAKAADGFANYVAGRPDQWQGRSGFAQLLAAYRAARAKAGA